MRALALVLLAGCPRQVPEHLRVQPAPDVIASQAEFTDLAGVLGALAARDPLVRAPALPDPARVDAVDGGAPVADWIREVKQLERGDGDAALVMQQVADRHPSTAAVALSRGYRLRRAENLLGNLIAEQEETAPGTALAAMITPLRPGTVDPNLARSPLAFIAKGGNDAVRAYADRWVLTGWLVDPSLPLAPVASALTLPQFDGLATTPIGAILARRVDGTADPAEGLALLERATLLSLTRAAADRDREQVAWAQLKRESTEALGGDPESTLLKQALVALTASAADDRGAGGALVAAAALRWLGACDDAPCTGIDRTESFAFAARFGPEVERLARVWQAIAIKDALDTMDVGHDTIAFSEAAVALVDALLGTGAGPIEMGVLRRSRPDPSVWLGIARSVGGDGATEWQATRSALAGHAEQVFDRALAVHPDGPLHEPLARIRKRTIR